MLKLLIVEDDLTIRKGLAECIPWESYGIEVSGEAANGKKALEFIEANPVDIMITDVAMPQMDGIELVRKVREKALGVKVAFISGHSELQLLKEAFRLDAVDYIVKPVKREELDAVLRKISGLCLQEKKQRDNLEELKRKLAESMPVLKERFISMLLKRRISDTEAMESRMKFLGLPLRGGMKFTVMALDVAAFYEDRSRENQGMREMELLTALEGIRPEDASGWNSFFLVEDDSVVIFILFSETSLAYDQAIELAREIQRELRAHTGYIPAAGIGKEVRSPGELYYSYTQSRRALEQKYFLGQDAVIHIDDIERANSKEMPDLSEAKERVIGAVRFGRRTEAEDAVDALFKAMRDMGAANMKYVRNVCIELAVLAEKEYFALKISDSRGYNERFTWDSIFQCKSFEDTQLWLKRELADRADTIRSVKANTSGNLTAMMLKYVRENYAQDITIHTLAGEFFITSNYVCILFKKETGKTFNDYLTEVRMEKAKEFLQNPVLKVYEIAEKIGYRDVDYFSKLFKKHTGLTLSQYRGKSG